MFSKSGFELRLKGFEEHTKIFLKRTQLYKRPEAVIHFAKMEKGKSLMWKMDNVGNGTES